MPIQHFTGIDFLIPLIAFFSEKTNLPAYNFPAY